MKRKEAKLSAWRICCDNPSAAETTLPELPMDTVLWAAPLRNLFLSPQFQARQHGRHEIRRGAGVQYSHEPKPEREQQNKISGIRKRTCLVSASKAPFIDFPMAVKKSESSRHKSDMPRQHSPFAVYTGISFTPPPIMPQYACARNSFSSSSNLNAFPAGILIPKSIYWE